MQFEELEKLKNSKGCPQVGQLREWPTRLNTRSTGYATAKQQEAMAKTIASNSYTIRNTYTTLTTLATYDYKSTAWL